MLKLIVIMLGQYCEIYCGFLHIHQWNYLKLVWNCCDEFEQLNGGRLMSYVFNYSTAWVNQFEIKDTYIKFAINNVWS